MKEIAQVFKEKWLNLMSDYFVSKGATVIEEGDKRKKLRINTHKYGEVEIILFNGLKTAFLMTYTFKEPERVGKDYRLSPICNDTENKDDSTSFFVHMLEPFPYLMEDFYKRVDKLISV